MSVATDGHYPHLSKILEVLWVADAQPIWHPHYFGRQAFHAGHCLSCIPTSAGMGWQNLQTFPKCVVYVVYVCSRSAWNNLIIIDPIRLRWLIWLVRCWCRWMLMCHGPWERQHSGYRVPVGPSFQPVPCGIPNESTNWPISTSPWFHLIPWFWPRSQCLFTSQIVSIWFNMSHQIHHLWCNIDPDMESWDDDYNDYTCRSKRLRDTVGVPISALPSLPGGLKLSSKSCTVILQTEVKPCFMTRETVPLPWNK